MSKCLAQALNSLLLMTLAVAAAANGVCYVDNSVCGEGLEGPVVQGYVLPLGRYLPTSLSSCEGMAEGSSRYKSWAGTVDGQSVCCKVFQEGGTTCEPKAYSGSGGGDPHFKLWHGNRIDFHGGCDLVLVSAASFGSGTGLQIQIRTTIESGYSFIEEVAVKIGRDVLQVAGNGIVYFNDVGLGEDLAAELPADISGFPVIFSKDEYGAHSYTIMMGHEDQVGKIRIITLNEMVWVDIDGATRKDFGDAVGLLGDFSTGEMRARDGHTVLEDADAFGQEWQVTGGNLFQTDRIPQYPQICDMPDPSANVRRLGESIAGLRSAANEACARWGDGADACVFDVMATGRLEVAVVGAF